MCRNPNPGRILESSQNDSTLKRQYRQNVFDIVKFIASNHMIIYFPPKALLNYNKNILQMTPYDDTSIIVH